MRRDGSGGGCGGGRGRWWGRSAWAPCAGHAAAGLALIVHDGSAGLEAALAEVAFGPGVLQQRCVFHVLRNVRDKGHGTPGMSRAAKQARRRAVLESAAAIW